MIAAMAAAWGEFCCNAQNSPITKIRLLECPYIYTYTYLMRYTSHPTKKAANLKKHGYHFDEAPQVIESASAMTFEDRRFQYDEQRFVTLGVLRGIAHG